ncbi:MAG: hybrid sensor histidine kinase/response regulator [Gallionellaceae bacterium]|jgi:signal transduction histidine kinase
MANPFLQSLSGELSFQITEDNLRIRSDQLRARLHLYPVMIFSQVLLAPLFVWMFWEHAEHAHLLLWLTLFYAIQTADILQWWRHHEQISTIQECKRWSRVCNLLTSLTALMWGSIAILFFPQEMAYQALMICLVLGLVAGAVTLNPVYPPSMYLYVLGVTLPLLVRLIMEGNQIHGLLAGMLILFLFVLLSAGRELSRTFWQSLWQRYFNDLLIEQLTEQKAIAETANRDKSRFLASASHDLRQPLQALVLFSESLQEITTEKEPRHLAEQIGRSVGALVDMFDELLDISKFDAGVVRAVKRSFSVQTVLDRLHTEFMPLALAKDLELIVPACDLVGYSDPHFLERILRNLISNAIRYTDMGHVQVSCKRTSQSGEAMLQFAVEDTGIGIRASSLPHIFEEYYQVDNQHRDRLQGLGLGLAIVRRMETLLGCKVSVASKTALGSVFSFSIPPGDPQQLERPLAAIQNRYDLGGITVALVEDDQDIRQMAAQLMRQWGCIVYEGELPHEVLQPMALAGVRPDIMLCDYRLPQGVTAIDSIRLLHQLWNNQIPTVVLTGDTAPQTLQAIESSGALLLNKPIAPARLRSMVYFALHQEKGPDTSPPDQPVSRDDAAIAPP